ncbi:MAG: phage tail tape measure protein [Planctomycetaceae bacterium]|jgi:TP901 family phage tail tape measure protein|nr:phage tail tape measure protein [Planctomycetaceae bacterium]
MSTSSAIRAGRAFVELFADDSALVRTLRRAETKVVQFGTNLQSIGRKLFTLGTVSALPFGLSMKVFSDFDDQIRAVKAVTGATGKEFDDLTEKAKLLGRTTSFTASQVAAAMLELGRAGFAPKEIDAAIPSVLNLARATGTELATSAEICANTLRSFELPATEMTRVCDVMVAAANNSAQTLEDLGESMTYCSPIASEYGLSLEQTAKALGSLANYGIKGSQAGTTLRRILTNLAAPSTQKKLKGLGVDVVDGDTGKLREVSEILRDLGKATAQMPKDQKLGLFKEIFGLYAIAGGAKLTVAQFDKLIEAVDNAAGTGNRAAKEMDAGIGGSLRMLWSAAEGVAVAVGEALAPSLKKLTDYFTNVSSGIAAYLTANKQLVVSVAKTITIITGVGTALFVTGLAIVGIGKSIGIVAAAIASAARIALAGISIISGAISVLTLMSSGIVSAFTAVVSGLGLVFGGIAAAFTAALSGLAAVATTVFTGIAAAITFLVSPIGLVVLALAVVGTAAILIYRHFSNIRNVVSNVFNGIASAISNALTAVYSFLNGFVEFKILFTIVQRARDSLRLLGQTFLWLGQNIVQPVMLGMVNAFVWTSRQIFSIGQTIGASLVSVFSRVGGFVAAAFQGVVSIVRNVFTSVVSVIGGVVSTLGNVFSPILSLVNTVFGGAVCFISGFVSALQNAAGWVVSLARNFFVIETGIQVFSLLSRAVSGVTGIFSMLTGGIIGTFLAVVQNIPSVIATIVRLFMAVPGSILSVFQRIPPIIGSIFSTAVGIVRGVVSGIGSVLTGLLSLMSGMWNGLAGIFVTVFNTLGSIVSGFGNFFVGVFASVGTAVDWLKDRFGSLCSFAAETFSVIAEVLGRGDIETAIQVIWASLKLIWVKGSTSLLSTWYWLTETLQTAWANCVFKVSELLTTAWFGVQQFWTETVYTMSTLWVEFANGVASAWKNAEKTIAQGIGYIIARMQGLDPNEMANIINEDYNRQAQQRENEKSQKLSAIQQPRDTKMSSLESDKQGTIGTLREDFDRNAAGRKNDYDTKIAAQESELQSAKNAYNEAINRAKNPVQPEGTEEPESLQDRLKSKAEEVMKGFKANTDFGSKVSVSGSFSAAAIQSMGFGSSMDRAAKAAEKSEKHLEKLVNKNDQPDKPQAKKKDEPDSDNGDEYTIRELKQQTRYLRDISEQGFSQRFA